MYTGLCIETYGKDKLLWKWQTAFLKIYMLVVLWLYFYKIMTRCQCLKSTVEPVLSGPVLSGHPLLSGQLSKSRKLLPLITVILTSIKRSPLLSGRGHPLLSPDELFLLS